MSNSPDPLSSAPSHLTSSLEVRTSPSYPTTVPVAPSHLSCVSLPTTASLPSLQLETRAR